MKKHPICGISLIMDPNNTFHMTALLDGPSESVYEEG
jgi:ubiquitin-protein ligase